MRKAKSLTGLKIITQNNGQDLGTVRDLIFSETTQRLVAFLLTDRELFGVIDATCVRFESVREIGPDAIMIPSVDDVVKVHADPVIAEGYDAQFTLDGKQVTTDGGEKLGRVSDLYLDESGFITGYEISGGLFSDAFNGKRYLDAPARVTMGQDVIVVPQSVTLGFQQDKQNNPGGISGVIAGATASVAGTFDSAKTAVSESYNNIAEATVDKQRAYVIGKIAGHDVTAPNTESVAQAPELIVSAGGLITAEIADHAIATNSLGSLVSSATAGSVSQTVEQGQNSFNQGTAEGQSKLQSALGTAQSKAEQAALGKPSAREIIAPDGSIIVAPGMIVTPEILSRADSYGKKNEVIAAAGLGAVSEGAQKTYVDAKVAASSVWSSLKDKAAELTGVAQEKKAEHDASSQEKRIKNAIGRPVTRVILTPDDTVILNTGDIITNKAISIAQESNAIDILLDSVYEGTPDLTPDTFRVSQNGDAALESQPSAEQVEKVQST
jgi:uncharacterized protein YrrD